MFLHSVSINCIRKNINDICKACGLNRRFHCGKGGCTDKLRKSREIKVVNVETKIIKVFSGKLRN